MSSQFVYNTQGKLVEKTVLQEYFEGWKPQAVVPSKELCVPCSTLNKCKNPLKPDGVVEKIVDVRYACS